MTQERMAYRGKFNDGGLVALTGAIVIYGFIYSHFMMFLTTKMGISSTPVYLAVIGLGLVMASGVLVHRPLPRPSSMIVASVAAYVGILLASLMFVDSSAWELTYNRIFWAMMAVSATILLSNLRSGRTFVFIVRSIFLFSSAIVIAEFASDFSLPVEMTTVRGRAAGLFQNSNIAALFLSMMVPIVTLGSRMKYRIIWYTIALLSVVLTFSRGGLILCVTAIILVEVLPAEKCGVILFRRLIFGALIFLVLCVAYLLLAYGLTTVFGSALTANTVERIRLESDSSSEIRLELIRSAWESFAASPIWGRGTGAGDRLMDGTSAHNQFALVAVEYGAIGLIWFGVFLGALWSIARPFGIWAATLFAVASMTFHNLTDSATYALIVASYAALPAILTRSSSARSRPEINGRPPLSIGISHLSGTSGERARNVSTLTTYRH